MALKDIEHIVVVMMENRSFDNLLGWLYDENSPPPFNIPDQQPTSFEGLKPSTYYNELNGNRIYASHPPTAWPPANNPNVVPTPDPHEEFQYVTVQIFGTDSPSPDAKADMSGFLLDYSASDAGGSAGSGQIMQSFGPADANVINDLARNFAVCDHWYASVPSQTWPNRGFVHTGSSDGHLDNDNYELYNISTIFNVLESQNKTWGVFHDTTLIPSLTLTQFSPQLLMHDDKFYKYDTFKKLCTADADAPAAQKLPQYSFVEPRFTPELGLFEIDYPEDYHPPHNICRGEQFLADVYKAVSSSPYRDKILLIITFDEHGGCYDHVPPPTGAAPPAPKPFSNDGSFDFNRFGVRVPAIVISSYVRPGTVFRAPPGDTPFDHTALLATLRDWLNLDADPNNPFLPSPRIQGAPTLDCVLTLDDTNKNTSWPAITANCSIGDDDKSLDTPLNGLQKSLIASAIRKKSGTPTDAVTVVRSTQQAKTLKTYGDAIKFMHPDAP
jgi:phospholipase C